MKRWSVLLALVALICSPSTVAAAHYMDPADHSVHQPSRQIRMKSATNFPYTVARNHGKAAWNGTHSSHNHVVIVMVADGQQPTVKWLSLNDPGSDSIGRWEPGAEPGAGDPDFITLNECWLGPPGDQSGPCNIRGQFFGSERQENAVAAHELGHALNLADHERTDILMDTDPANCAPPPDDPCVVNPQDHDADDYHERWP